MVGGGIRFCFGVGYPLGGCPMRFLMYLFRLVVGLPAIAVGVMLGLGGVALLCSEPSRSASASLGIGLTYCWELGFFSRLLVLGRRRSWTAPADLGNG